MSPLIVLCCVALAAAKPSGFHSVAYSVPSTVVASPVSVSSQYHAQDAQGQYTYGYSAGSSAKAESKTADGVTRGGYSYVDGSGIVQTANYIADDVSGFQVAATNLPKHVAASVYDTPEVAAAKAAHVVAYNEAAIAAAASPDISDSVVVSAPAISSYVASAPAVSQIASVVASVPSVTSYSIHDSVALSPGVSVISQVPSKAFSYSTVSASPSVSVAATPAAVSYSVGAEKIPVLSYSNVPVVAVKQSVPAASVSYSVPSSVISSTSQQYYAQDALGQYTYGYSGGPSAKVETKTLDGVTRGGYSYVDGNGIVQTANYVADDVTGFRVAATNIPVGPESSLVRSYAVAPYAVSQYVAPADTPEVVAAKAAHFAAHAAVKYHGVYGYYDDGSYLGLSH